MALPRESGLLPSSHNSAGIPPLCSNDALSLLSKYAIRQHPAGDRSSIPGSSLSSASADSARSQRSTPGRPSSRSSSEGSATEYAAYYSSWRDLATSKAEQDAAARLLLLLPPQAPQADIRANRAHANSGVPPRSKKPVTVKQKRLHHLERMKQVWRIVDVGANVHNQMSAEEFLHADLDRSARSSTCHSPHQAYSPVTKASLRFFNSSTDFSASHEPSTSDTAVMHRVGAPPRDTSHASKFLLNIAQTDGHSMRHCGAPLEGTPSSSVHSTPRHACGAGAHADDAWSVTGASERRHSAMTARSALRSVGIQRPPSSRSDACPSHPSYSPAMSCHSPEPLRSSIPQALGHVPVHQCEEASTLSGRRRMRGDAPRHIDMQCVAEDAAHVHSPLRSPGDAGWDAELDELLEWTEKLGTLPEV